MKAPAMKWTGYAAAVWAIAYAVFVRFYQAAGGTIGLPGQVEDPEGLRRASAAAGVLILIAGLGALAFVRPWGLRLPRAPVIALALAGSVFAIGHAITAYVTKPLHALGVIDLEFKGWETVDETKLILWDLLFYEPWFLGLGVLVTLGALHHHRRTGGSAVVRRRLVAATIAGSVALGAWASIMVAT